ncbi:Fe-S cluster assembly ATPase SufC [Litorilinea aerophila]|uniref:Fe-S cluster assembly ATPase SufC n=1 Tax=Litorilinea aerophila TaxID=1204385 RepID=A0A540VEF5_9CHLR|nr:Fe-S cluster assembly ATPase SufC [Litorilinea aerophila]MCC9077093.1 Fe-S cluster assembly ATPase SufC [Litorilinea aerophila]GIV76163.1 MAG: ABC transporter ATP-binding protein [Litorilinea sp.]
MSVLEIRNLHAAVEDNEILKGVNLTLRSGEIHALMGPNGSGKSTLAYVIAGHPHYEVTEGDILLDGESILDMEADERARAGIFLAFQYPVAIPGVSVANFLRTAVSNVRGYTEQAKKNEGGVIGSNLMPMREFRRELNAKMKEYNVDPSFARRYLNDGFSGGEKKRTEVLQMAMLEPKFAILDESDSGLDIDALRVVADGINKLATPDRGFLLITHYQRILNYVKPHYVSIFYDGRIVKTGGPEVAHMLEERGYGWVEQEFKDAQSVAA